MTVFSADAHKTEPTDKGSVPLLTNEEAAKYLESANAGLCPNLSRRGYRFAKRTFDIIASGVAIVILFIPSLILCAVICIKSPGAAPLYSQLRGVSRGA